MKRVLVAILGASLTLGLVGSASAFQFADMNDVAWAEGTAPVSVAPDLILAFDGLTMPHALTGSVTISGGFRAGDRLTYGGALLIQGSYNSASGVLSLTTGVNPDNSFWQAAMRAVTFTTTADPPGSSRTLTYTTDNTSGNRSGQNTISITIGAPDRPLAPTVTGGSGQATISIVPPGSGLAPTSRLVTASPGGATCTVSGSSGSCTITALTNGIAYTFTDTAIRYGVSSQASPGSSVVTLAAPETPITAITPAAPLDTSVPTGASAPVSPCALLSGIQKSTCSAAATRDRVISRATSTRSAARAACAKKTNAIRAHCTTKVNATFTRSVAVAKVTYTRTVARTVCTTKTAATKKTCLATANARYRTSVTKADAARSRALMKARG